MLAESCSLPWRLEALLFLWHRCCSEAGSTDGRSTDELGSQGEFALGKAGKTRFISLGPVYLSTTHASTTGSKLTYTLAGDSSPVTPLGARPRNPN